ncbi:MULTISPECIES: GNAT family N-acetyltransferase [Vibrio]|uniref:GNAT family N-acetyltransferase n=1 Tax=Vibrio casei TaxID=673372 RepID=A0A368LHW1_9VIBR|nr:MULTISPECIES: GNAT family N-acetyltransferase [Vibrio]RCS70330.1 GNAT family N-acetyltransferase [Vibrio casei]SJN19970.1 Acetyltransferase, GNAT family [Vibrio casei]HBV76980.1 N-acetyltransferase [Vibrio sp.]
MNQFSKNFQKNKPSQVESIDLQITEIPDEVWPQIEKIQEVAYRDGLAEDIDILKIKSDVSPETCFVYMNEEDQVLGYVLAHPWESDVPPCINQDISERDEVVSMEDASTLYIHDLAINPDARGAGIAQALVENVITHAEDSRIDKISLVAVQGMASFWAKYGFKSVRSDSTDSYGDDAQFMVNQL